MKIQHCQHEEEVVHAIRTWRWTTAWGAEIRQHAALCSVCQEVAFIAEMLRGEAEAANHARLPGAGLVWWKARRAARHADEERAAQPIAFAERIALALGALAAFGFVAWQWLRVTGWQAATRWHSQQTASSTSAEWAHHLAREMAQAWPGQSPAYLVIASIGAFLSLLGFAAYVVWREE